jgi:hypothetical protein
MVTIADTPIKEAQSFCSSRYWMNYTLTPCNDEPRLVPPIMSNFLCLNIFSPQSQPLQSQIPTYSSWYWLSVLLEHWTSLFCAPTPSPPTAIRLDSAVHISRTLSSTLTLAPRSFPSSFRLYHSHPSTRLRSFHSFGWCRCAWCVP